MKILITGGTGLIGTKLKPLLEAKGHEVFLLTRRPRTPHHIEWNEEAGTIDIEGLKKMEGIIHLAGENIAEGRWTEDKKKRIYNSRVRGTNFLISNLLKMEILPQYFIAASAIGFYGDRGEEDLSELSAAGDSFVAKVCRDWEKASQLMAERGVRMCIARIGIVLDPKGGALHKMLLPFRLGLGGSLGNGKQWMSWIDHEDLLRAFVFLTEQTQLEGTFNFTAPVPVRQRDFAKQLASKLGRPSFLPAPQPLVRMAFGEMADNLLLASMKVLPTRLLKEGFEFRYPKLKESLDHQL